MGCNGSSSDSSKPDATASVNIEEVRERVIAWYPIGIADDPATRNVRPPLVEEGWEDSGFIHGVLGQLEANDRGLRRVMLHNPFGREVPMQFDAYLEALEIDALDKVTGTFVDAWRNNVTKPSLGLDIEVIAYLGSPRLDEDSQRILEQEGEQAFTERALRAIEPLQDTGMAIGYDAAAGTAEDSATYRFGVRMQSMGIKVYIEATPPADHIWWFDYPVIILEETWQERKDDPRFASREDLRGELIRIVRVDSAWVEGHSPRTWPEAMCRVIAEGDSLAVSFLLLRQPERHLEDLVDCANEYTARMQNEA